MVMAWASLKMNDFGKHRLYLGADVRAGARLPREQVLRVRATTSTHGEGPWHSTFLAIYFTLTGLHGLHILGGMVVMAYFSGPGAKMWKTKPGAVHQPHRDHRALLALRRPGLDLPVPGVVSAVGGERHDGLENAMHSDAAEIKKSIRTYMMVGRGAAGVHGDHRGGQSDSPGGAAGHHGGADHRDDQGRRWSRRSSCT